MENNALVVVEKLNPVEIFQEGGMPKVLREIEAKATAIVADVETDGGRKEIASVAYKVARSKTLIDDIGKAMVADWKKKAKVVDEVRKEARDFLEALKDRVREPLTTWEKEQERIQKEKDEQERQELQRRVEALQQYGKIMSMLDVSSLTDAEYETLLEETKTVWEAEQARIEAEKKAREEEAAQLAAERAEIEKIRAEQAALKAEIDAENRRIAEERAKVEAERRAEQEKKNREAFEKQVVENARIKAEEEARARAEREAIEAKRREAQAKAEQERQESLKPDKEKLLSFAEMLLSLNRPEIKDAKAQRILLDALDVINEAAENIKVFVRGL